MAANGSVSSRKLSSTPGLVALLTTAVMLGSVGSLLLSASSQATSGLCAHPTIVGTKRAELIRGTAGNDIIIGRGGDDTIRARRGDDVVCGGKGGDDISGGAGDDVLNGNGGSNNLNGGAGRDVCTNGRSVSCETGNPPTTTSSPSTTVSPTMSPTPTPTATKAPSVATSPNAASYTEDGPPTTIDGGLIVTDPDDSNLESAQVSISDGFGSLDELVFENQLGIFGFYDAGSGVLTLTGTASVANYEVALRSVKFRTRNDNPATSKVIEFRVDDGDSSSNGATKAVTITRVNDVPAVETSGTNLDYTEGDGAVAVDAGVFVTDPDSESLQGATVSISANFTPSDDSLGFTNVGNIAGSYDSGTGVLTLSGVDTVANYEAALRSVTFTNTTPNPSGSKTVSIVVVDGEGVNSNSAFRVIDLHDANTGP